ncbi:hypothetical protein A2U01_0029571, partial [Trifolium medium]|nr:hypothetical protein [Trifolium medium]
MVTAFLNGRLKKLKLCSRKSTDSTAKKTITFGGVIEPVHKDEQNQFENIQATVVNQGPSIKNLETKIGQLSKLVTTFSQTYAGNTVDNPKEEK